MITIQIKYLMCGEKTWHAIDMPPHEYFYEKLERYEVDDIPLYDEMLDYLRELLGEAAKDIIVVEEALYDTETKQRKRHTRRYWNNQRNWVNELVMSPPDEYHELLFCTEISEIPYVTETLRMVWEEGILRPIDHVFITDNPDGTQSGRPVPLKE
ncbi:MAG: hypothetical protein ACYDBB_04560 [Armatimonadota bacterium]